ncbi:MAG: hypothetical protein HY328_12000, partial [Chloroflexi bacterium]|nr:hypothetical protein [Chloroflexota bacterium]
MQPASDTFSLRAVDSADRMAQSLSPWVREMLDGGSAPTAGGSLVRRLLRRRADESVSFLSTLAILRRFHRIATRTSAWKANVGTISPNLFEKFSEEIFKNWDMGANNISALLKINRQEEAIDMPLAGEVGGPTASQPQQPVNPLAGMTMEEIRRRVEEARKFESMSPSALPNFVKAQDAARPDVRPVAQPPGNRPAPAPQRPFDQPIARPVPGQTPPTPPPAQQPAEQPAQPSPRMMRRRMARQVEYLSMPAAEGNDGGETASGDDSEAVPPPQFDTGPPGLDWFFPEPENSAPDWFAPTAAEETILRQTAPQSRSPRTVRSRSARGARTTSTSGIPLQPTPIRLARRPTRRTPDRPAALRDGRSRPLGIVQRVVERLAVSTSGQLLASRPHLLLDHIQRQSVAPAQQPRPASALLPSALDNRLGDGLSFVPQPSVTALLPRRTDENTGLTPISLTDFALPYPQRLWQRADPLQADQPVTTPVQSEQPAVRMARALLPSARPGQTPRSDEGRQPQTHFIQPRPDRQPVARSRALAA